jgi:hypothetical protein
MHDAPLCLGRDRVLSLICSQQSSRLSFKWERRRYGERKSMSKPYVIEVSNRTAGIVAQSESGLRFFSSERIFDSLEGREFFSIHHIEREARRLLTQRRNTGTTRYRSLQNFPKSAEIVAAVPH